VVNVIYVFFSFLKYPSGKRWPHLRRSPVDVSGDVERHDDVIVVKVIDVVYTDSASKTRQRQQLSVGGTVG
jgi:hypothetical protein